MDSLAPPPQAYDHPSSEPPSSQPPRLGARGSSSSSLNQQPSQPFQQQQQQQQQQAMLVSDVPTYASVYTTSYQGVPVLECIVRGIAVMRRRSDSWMNATQILKVAGIDKNRRTKILESEVVQGVHEKISGGYGKYQGTWVPNERGLALAHQYGVDAFLASIFDPSLVDPAFVAQLASGRGLTNSPSKSTAAANGSRQPPSNGTAQPSALSRQLTIPSANGSYPHSASSPFQPAPHILHHPAGPPVHGGYPSASGVGLGGSSSSGSMGIGQKRGRQDDSYSDLSGGGGGGYDVSLGDGSGLDEFDSMIDSRFVGGDSPMGPPSSKRIRSESGMSSHSQPLSYPPPPDISHSQYPPHHPSPAQFNSYSFGNAQAASSSSSHHLEPSPYPSQNDHSYTSNGSYGSPHPSNSHSYSEFGTSHQPALSSTRSQPPPPPALPIPSAVTSFQPQYPSQQPLSHPHHTQPSLRPLDPAHNPDPSRQRASLLSLFDPTLIESFSPSNPDPPDLTPYLPHPQEAFDPELILDPQGHTALHWACALARPNLVAFLLARGAQPRRGNHQGETPLMRCVLATNAYEGSAFGTILGLGEMKRTLRTVDGLGRSVLHHVALVAGVEGRAGAARHYMESLLEQIAKDGEEVGGGSSSRPSSSAGGGGEQGGDGSTARAAGYQARRTILDIVDNAGDTALLVAARVGNRSLIKSLVDAGADKTVANKVGLRAGDFGIEEEILRVSPQEQAVAAIRDPVPLPTQKSKDVIADLTSTITSLHTTFLAELEPKSTALSAAQAHLLSTTAELAKERRAVHAVEGEFRELELVRRRIGNLKRALEGLRLPTATKEGEGQGRGGWGLLGGGNAAIGEAKGKEKETEPSSGLDVATKPEPTAPSTSPYPSLSFPEDELDPSSTSSSVDARTQLLALRRLKSYQSQIFAPLEGKMAGIVKDGEEKAGLFRKIIGICSGLKEDVVGEMLDKLVVAIESDGASLDQLRVTKLLQNVRDQQV